MGTGASSLWKPQYEASQGGTGGTTEFSTVDRGAAPLVINKLVTGFMETQVKHHIDGMSSNSSVAAKYAAPGTHTNSYINSAAIDDDAEDADDPLDRDQLSSYSMAPLHLVLRTSSKSDDGAGLILFPRQGSLGLGALGASQRHVLLRQGSGNSDGTASSSTNTATGTSNKFIPSSGKVLKSQKSLRSMALRSHSRQENAYIPPSELIAQSQSSFLHLSKTRAATPLGSHGGSVGSNISGAAERRSDSHNNSSASIGGSESKQQTPKGSGANLLGNAVATPKGSGKDLGKAGTTGGTEVGAAEHAVQPAVPAGVTASLMPSMFAGKGLTIVTSQTQMSQGPGHGQAPAEPKPLVAKRPQLKLQLSNGNIDDADWIQVSDDEGDDEDQRAHQRISLSLLNHAAQQSYLLTKSGTLFVDGFTGGIGKGGINTAGGSTSGLLPLQDRLVFLCRLGAGASGVVYKALDMRDMRLVALKMIPMFDRGKRRQMVRELSALFQMLHQRNQMSLDVDVSASGGNVPLGEVRVAVEGKGQPETESDDIIYPSHLTAVGQQQRPSDYIVDFYDAFSNIDEGDVALMMEYMDGGSLQDIVVEGGCDNETTLASIAAQALVGLTFLHRCAQLHRDIKPGNFLISKRGFVKIADFGILRQMDETAAKSETASSAGNVLDTVVESPTNRARNTGGDPYGDMPRAQTFIGTATYMAPERIDGREYSYPSDIWSFGLALLTIALGKLPIDTQGGYWTILHHIRDCDPPQVPDTFSEEFRDFISQCLQKDPQERKSAIQLLRHPFLLQAAAEEDTEGDEEIGKAELAEILCAVAQHLEKRKEESQKHPPTPVAGDAPLPGTLAHTLIDIGKSKIKDLMNKLFFPGNGTTVEKGQDDSNSNSSLGSLGILAAQLHLSPALLKTEVHCFIDNLSDNESSTSHAPISASARALQQQQLAPPEYLVTPKASHTRK